ncbi:signal peptidase II [Chlamydiia bacterium]|nr:signal peptidase II [Chlamydiia bacterium]
MASKQYLKIIKNTLSSRWFLTSVIIALILFCTDQYLKYLSISAMQQKMFSDSYATYVFISDITDTWFGIKLDWVYSTNTGMAWSVMSSQPLILFGIRIVILSALSFIVLTQQYDRFKSACLVCVMSGAISNIVDVLRRGMVIDYIHATLLGWTGYPVFNIADVVIVVSVGLFLISSLRYRTEHYNN